MTTSSQEEKKRHKVQSESKPIEEENETSSPSIYGVVAAHSLAEQKYDPVFCKDVTVKITEEIKERVKKLCYPRYKFVCHVIVGDVNRQDVRVVSRCAWDAAVDRYAQFEYRSFYLYAVGIVYGIYCE